MTAAVHCPVRSRRLVRPVVSPPSIFATRPGPVCAQNGSRIIWDRFSRPDQTMFRGISSVADLLLIEVRIIGLLICPSPAFSSFLRGPLSRAFWPADAQMSTGSLPVLPFCVFSVQQFPVASLVSIHISPSIPIWESTVCYNKNSTAQRGPGGKVGLFRNHVKYQ